MAQIKIRSDEMSQLKKPVAQFKIAQIKGDAYAGGIEGFHQVDTELSIHCYCLCIQARYAEYMITYHPSVSSALICPGKCYYAMATLGYLQGAD
jgi:hypothetical protein